MLQPTVNDIQYVLSLDSLDLNFLGQYVEKKTEERKLLWSNPYSNGDSTLYEVKLVCKDNQDDDYCIEMYDTYLCGLCNIDVPQSCHRQHIKSKMHECYKTLTEKVLENVARQINEDHNYNECYKENYSYYCDICSKLVYLKHRQKHNESNFHLKCMEKEELVNTFLDMYSQTVDTKNNSTFYSINDENDSISEYNNSRDIIDLDAVENSFQKINSKSSVLPINNIGTKPSDIKYFQCDLKVDHESFVESNKNKTDFELYLRDMITKYNLNYHIPSVENNKVVIVTPKGYKESITIDTFHSYSELPSLGTHCWLCNKFCLNEKEHRTSKAHVERIIQPVNDYFCREVSNSDFPNQKRMHCLLCNIVFSTDKNHEHHDQNHKKYNQERVVDNTDVATPKNTFCDVCGISICTVNYPEHTEGKKHKAKAILNGLLKSKLQSCSLDTSGPEIIYAGSYKNETQLTKPAIKVKMTTKTFCESCHIYIDTHNFQAHIKGQRHKNQLIESTTATELKPLENIKTDKDVDTEKLRNFCHTCRVFVPSGGMNIHCAGRIHRSNQIRNPHKTEDIPTSSTSVTQAHNVKKKRTRNKSKKSIKVAVHF